MGWGSVLGIDPGRSFGRQDLRWFAGSAPLSTRDCLSPTCPPPHPSTGISLPSFGVPSPCSGRGAVCPWRVGLGMSWISCRDYGGVVVGGAPVTRCCRGQGRGEHHRHAQHMLCSGRGGSLPLTPYCSAPPGHVTTHCGAPPYHRAAVVGWGAPPGGGARRRYARPAYPASHGKWLRGWRDTGMPVLLAPPPSYLTVCAQAVALFLRT